MKSPNSNMASQCILHHHNVVVLFIVLVFYIETILQVLMAVSSMSLISLSCLFVSKLRENLSIMMI